MGNGYSFECKKCHCKYGVSIGVGYGFPNEYKKKLKEAASGKWGAERQAVLKATPYAAINAEQVVYICPSCGTWEEGTDHTIYAPNDPKKIAKVKYGEKTAEELGGVPYVMECDLKNDYHAIKRYYRACPKCGKRMHKASGSELYILPCPKCGTINEIPAMVMWD